MGKERHFCSRLQNGGRDSRRPDRKIRSRRIGVQADRGIDRNIPGWNFADIADRKPADQEIVAGILGYPERFDADIGAQLFLRPLLGVLQRPIRDRPELLGGSPQASQEDRQNRGEYRDYQRGPIVGARGNA
jgi:hypothetical protein